ncbi:carbohydrate-binding protein [Pontibacter sp. G13]|uniref:carbohydrate-binding protein n=1 Tax=Pontibacter sp. G13 TaxID=3074898 RepID=UPI00288AB414|nr:carbohydrate-binding protein [Pontibacter sp. G13]WNJ18287.1 carbohydrate-binding protein [Pontibacter sp. G13]
MKFSINLLTWVACCFLGMGHLYAQSAVSVGSGSYASYPPSHEYIGGQAANGTFQAFATNSANIDVDASKINDPIPTNDWWTSVLTMEDGNGNRHGGNLWTYPLLSRASTNGFEIGHRTAKDWTTDQLGSRTVTVDYLVYLSGSSFSPTKTIAVNWSDWHVDLRTQVGDNSSQRIDVTLAQGMPYVWAKTTGFDPVIRAIHPGVRSYLNASGGTQTFPATLDRFAIEYDGNLYGVHFPQNVTITETTAGLSIAGHDGEWIVFSALNSPADLNTLHQHAFVRPTHTSLDYSYDPSQGSVTATYNISTDVISGTQTQALQGFIPHHYRGNANSFSFSGLEYSGTPRGLMKMAAGTSFAFNYEFNADLLPHFTSPQVLAGESIPYDPAKMKSMIDAYANDVQLYGIGGGTYWGGKYLLRALKYTLMAKETGNDNYDDLLAATKSLVHDWLTYTPGETEIYYSYYPAWKALIGFNEEYYSAFFTDNHFHYGYLAHAAALLEMAEPGSMDGYWDMVEKVIKTYANWDKNDPEFPYLRTFSPWMGHSFANGLGNSIGNNQESSSEAMQSWAGMFMVAEMTGNTAMRDAAAFGYLTEGRAIADYWYNESGTFDEIGYTKPITGILEMNRYVYGTFFGAQETYIHGIQWLPISPAYGFWNDFLTASEAAAIVDPIMNNMSADLGGSISADWMNVSMGFKLFFDPESVVSQFDGYWNATPGTDEYNVAHQNGENGITYYYAHASQNIGVRQSNYRLSLPLSSAFEKNGTMTYVAYNPSSSAQTCEVYANGSLVTSFSVPAHTLYNSNGGGTTPPPSSSVLIQAEDYTSMSGIQTEGTADVGGGDNVGWINTGDWMEYSVNIPAAGTYTVHYRVASLSSGGNLTMTANGSTLDNTTFAATGSWQTWTMVSSTVTLNAGVQTIRITSNNNGWNINWFEFEPSGGSTPVNLFVEAEDYDAMSGIQTENTADAGGGENVGWIDAGDWLEYDISVPNAGSYSIDYRVASLSNGGDFTVTSDGNTVDNTTFSSTGSWQTWTTVSSTVNLPAGSQTIRITANTGGWNINWFEISSGGASRPVSIFELPEERIIAYPVPFGDQLHMTLPNTVDYEKVELLDLSGRIIMTQQVHATELQWETANLPSGVYLLRAFRRLGAPEILKIIK